MQKQPPVQNKPVPTKTCAYQSGNAPSHCECNENHCLQPVNRHQFTKIKKPHPSQIESTTTMSVDSHIYENVAIGFSISSPLGDPLGDPLGRLNKFSCLLDASDDEPLQCTVVDDHIEVIQNHIVCPRIHVNCRTFQPCPTHPSTS